MQHLFFLIQKGLQIYISLFHHLFQVKERQFGRISQQGVQMTGHF